MKLIRYQLMFITLLLSLLAGCAGVTYHAAPIKVTLSNIQLVDAQLLEQQYRLTLRVQNTNDSTLVINGLSYTLEVNGSEFAHGVNNEQNYILPYAEELISVSLISSSFNAIEQLGTLRNKANPQFNYRLKGQLSLGARYLPTPIVPLSFETSGRIELGKVFKKMKESEPATQPSFSGIIKSAMKFIGI